MLRVLLLLDPRASIVWSLVGIALLAAIFILYRSTMKKGIRKAKGSCPPTSQDKSGTSSAGPPDDAAEPARQTPAFQILEARHWILADLFRVFLVILSIVVAAGFVLVLLPQLTVDRIARDLRSRSRNALQEQIAFLYLGDQIENNEFKIRGVVRNVTTAPIEKLDAAIRLYSPDGTVLETTVVRMDKEIIAPDEIAQFNLIYPNYKSEFASYSVEFKLREGALVPYRDMRSTRGQDPGAPSLQLHR